RNFQNIEAEVPVLLSRSHHHKLVSGLVSTCGRCSFTVPTYTTTRANPHRHTRTCHVVRDIASQKTDAPSESRHPSLVGCKRRGCQGCNRRARVSSARCLSALPTFL